MTLRASARAMAVGFAAFAVLCPERSSAEVVDVCKLSQQLAALFDKIGVIPSSHPQLRLYPNKGNRHPSENTAFLKFSKSGRAPGQPRQIRSDCRCGVAGVKHAPSGFHCCPFARRATDFTVIGRSDGDGCGRAGGVLRPAGVSGGPSCAEGEWRGDGGSPQGRSGGRGPRAGVGGHLEEVEHTARISGQATHGLGDGEPARLDEADGEAA